MGHDLDWKRSKGMWVMEMDDRVLQSWWCYTVTSTLDVPWTAACANTPRYNSHKRSWPVINLICTLAREQGNCRMCQIHLNRLVFAAWGQISDHGMKPSVCNNWVMCMIYSAWADISVLVQFTHTLKHWVCSLLQAANTSLPRISRMIWFIHKIHWQVMSSNFAYNHSVQFSSVSKSN